MHVLRLAQHHEDTPYPYAIMVEAAPTTRGIEVNTLSEMIKWLRMTFGNQDGIIDIEGSPLSFKFRHYENAMHFFVRWSGCLDR